MAEAPDNHPSMRRRASLRDEARRARAHLRRAYWARVVALLLLTAGVADALTTELALRTGGAVELNPIIRATQAALGVWWIPAKMAAHLLLAAALMWYPNRPTIIAMAGVAVLTAAVAANNLVIYLTLSA